MILWVNRIQADILGVQKQKSQSYVGMTENGLEEIKYPKLIVVQNLLSPYFKFIFLHVFVGANALE